MAGLLLSGRRDDVSHPMSLVTDARTIQAIVLKRAPAKTAQAQKITSGYSIGREKGPGWAIGHIPLWRRYP